MSQNKSTSKLVFAYYLVTNFITGSCVCWKLSPWPYWKVNFPKVSLKYLFWLKIKFYFFYSFGAKLINCFLSLLKFGHCIVFDYQFGQWLPCFPPCAISSKFSMTVCKKNPTLLPIKISIMVAEIHGILVIFILGCNIMVAETHGILVIFILGCNIMVA